MTLDHLRGIKPAIEAAYGSAVLTSHALERRLVLHISIWERLKNGKPEAFTTMYQSLLKKPFGEIMRIGKANGAIPEDVYETLENARVLRNHLIHEISDSLVLRAFTKKESSEVVTELLEIADDFMGISDEISKMSYQCFDIARISIDDIKKRALSIVERVSQVDRLKDICPDRRKGPTPP